MYTVSRPPTPALRTSPCVPDYNEPFNLFTETDVEIDEEEQCTKKNLVKSGRLIIGRWGKGCRSDRSPEPPEVVVLQARLHTRSPKSPANSPPSQQVSKRPRQKEMKKSEKKFMKEPIRCFKADDESVRNDGRIIASKVLPIMAMLLQKSDEEDDDMEKPQAELPKKAQGPRLAVQCIQLLPSEPANAKKN